MESIIKNNMKDSRHSDSSYSSMLKRGQGGCVSPTTSGSSVGGGRSASDEDEYIRFLETEVFKTELERKKKEEAEHAHKAKLRERLELREAKEREAELREEEDRKKADLDRALERQERRIRENEKKLVTLANLVKTTQTFAEEQEGLLRQQLDRSMEGVEERLRSVESRSGASSMSHGDGEGAGEVTVEQGVQASPGEPEVAKPGLGEDKAKSMIDDAVKAAEDRMQRRSEKQIKALNRRWEERLRMMEERLGGEYQERLRVLESKVATKLEKIITKVAKQAGGASGVGKKAAKAAAARTEDRAGGAASGGAKRTTLAKHELATSLKALTRNVLEEMLATEAVEGIPSKENRVQASAPVSEPSALREMPTQAKAATKGAAPLRSSTAANARPSGAARPAKKAAAAKRSGSTRQERAKEDYEKRQERLKALYHEWTNLELESSSVLLAHDTVGEAPA